MSKTAWVIMKESNYPPDTAAYFINTPSIHMIGFSSKREALKECNRLNERSNSLNYFIEKAKVFQPWEP